MTRLPKKERLKLCPRKRQYKELFEKSGAKLDNLEKGYKEHPSALPEALSKSYFFPKLSRLSRS